jgi:hypothetical protein
MRKCRCSLSSHRPRSCNPYPDAGEEDRAGPPLDFPAPTPCLSGEQSAHRLSLSTFSSHLHVLFQSFRCITLQLLPGKEDTRGSHGSTPRTAEASDYGGFSHRRCPVLPGSASCPNLATILNMSEEPALAGCGQQGKKRRRGPLGETRATAPQRQRPTHGHPPSLPCACRSHQDAPVCPRCAPS